jgi:hypothetical protein
VTLRARTLAVVAVGFLACPLQGWGQTGPIRIPKEGDGYTITRSNTRSDPAPDGYAGRTDADTLTAVGNTPATMGKKIVARFMLANKIKVCPAADGKSEGSGMFSLSLDYTDEQPTGTTRFHIEMKTDGTYKGQVGDDAWLADRVSAEIDYTYTVSGSIHDPSGAIATPAGSNSAQRITIPFTVGRGMSAPGVGAFSGGDPTGGGYGNAIGAGTALVYWAGVYYSEAQTKWRDSGRCVSAVFAPTSNTTRIVPGGRTTVKGEIETKSGERVKARFLNARTMRSSVAGAAVTPSEGSSDVGAPMTFDFTAPGQKVDRTGFLVEAVSRAGVAQGEWIAGLGTDWRGRISVVTTHTGDAGASELLTWSNNSVTNMTAVFKDESAWASGYTEVRFVAVRRVRALRGGAVTIIFDDSTVTEGSLNDEVVAAVVVHATGGTYAIEVHATFRKEGKAQRQMCNRHTGCTNAEDKLPLPAGLPSITGKLDDPNHLQGSKTETKTGLGRLGTGTLTTTVTWDLAREGIGK